MSRIVRRPTLLLSALAMVTTGAAALGMANGGSAAAATHGSAAGSASAVKFSHAVIVDFQRPGFEPDVKSDGTGLFYSSVPNGFSTTISYVWSSAMANGATNHGTSYHLVPGSLVGTGKNETCFGGGDSDLFTDPANNLYFSDLQGLTDISNAVSSNGGDTWTFTCNGAPNSPDDRMWFTGTGTLSKDLVLYQDFDQVETNANSNDLGGNQLVETVSHDGVTFLPVLNTNVTSCTGTATDCVSDNEGISGNQVVDPTTGNVFIAHTTLNGNASGSAVGVAVSEGRISQGPPAEGTWTDSPNLDGTLCPGTNGTCVDSNGNPEEVSGENFATIARDSAGYLYVTFTAGPIDHASSSDPSFGYSSAPEQIYVVHSLEPATMTDPSKVTWSAPQRISGSGSTAGTNTFPWIVAGSDGRVDVAWYHTNEVSEQGTCPASGSGTCTNYGAGLLTKAEWTVVMAQSLNAHATSPTYTTTQVSESTVKHGPICTNGLGCVTGGDRSLGDFLQVTIDKQGAALVSYVYDTSADTSGGENAGPNVISRQIAGPSLIAGQTITQDGGPGVPMSSVTDPGGSAYYSANGTRTAVSSNLQLLGASLVDGPDQENGPGGKDNPNNYLIATIRVKSLASLSVSPTVGGPDASWMIRWTYVTPGQVGNGDIFYAGMDNNAGNGPTATPTFFVGNTACVPVTNPEEHCKYLAYPQTYLLSASQAHYNAKTGVITMEVPLKDVGATPSNPGLDGQTLYSITAFTATSAKPQSSSTLFNLIDAAPPFDHVVG